MAEPGTLRVGGVLGLRLPGLMELRHSCRGREAVFDRLVTLAEAAEHGGFGSLWVDDLPPAADRSSMGGAGGGGAGRTGDADGDSADDAEGGGCGRTHGDGSGGGGSNGSGGDGSDDAHGADGGSGGTDGDGSGGDGSGIGSSDGADGGGAGVGSSDGGGAGVDLVFEAYSVLGALAVHTRTVDLGALPWAGNVRPPSLLAKVASGLDVISRGRALVALGLPPTADPASVDRLAEELDVCRALMIGDEVSFEGAFFRLSAAVNRPRPVRQGGAPLVVLLGGPGALATAAAKADVVLVPGGPEVVGDVHHRLGRALGAAGRSADAVQLVWLSDVTLADVATGGDGAQMAADRLRRGLRAGAGHCVVSVGTELAADPSGQTAADVATALARAVAR